MSAEIVNFSDAKVGESAYTWKLTAGDWGDYKFETIDPQSTYTRFDFGGDDLTLTRKRWVLTEVVEMPFFDPAEDEEDDAS